MYIDKPETFETNVLDNIIDILNEKIDTAFGKISEMTDIEKKFLNGIIRQNKPKKVVEFGVASGGSSAIILNAIKDINDSILYSIDYSEKLYVNPNKKTGWVIEEKFPYLSNKWKLYTGGIGAKFIEEIGGDIDIVLLDTVHFNPGEFLDLLIVLPYIKKGGIIILHDILLQIYVDYNNSYTNGIIFSCLKGKKTTLNASTLKNLGNIGAVILDDDIMDRILDYFYLLTFNWNYMPTDEDILYITKLFKKNYDNKLIELFESIVDRNRKIFSNTSDKVETNYNTLEEKFDRFINSIAWWIPIRKWRDDFRNKILHGQEQSRAEQSRAEQSRLILEYI
ncbi:class I SAM-dependent methyltransferase [Brachyspira intermedia]|uniref:class I SAM-dependent methyltransferase n=1 Tax=Brachyspira intermedia TaxID=84377 RepID=UPI003003F8F6